MGDTNRREVLLPADAIAAIKRVKGKRVVLIVGQNAPIDDKTGIPVIGLVKVTKAAAIAFIKSAYRPAITGRGGRVVVDEYSNCLFIGESV